MDLPTYPGKVDNLYETLFGEWFPHRHYRKKAVNLDLPWKLKESVDDRWRMTRRVVGLDPPTVFFDPSPPLAREHWDALGGRYSFWERVAWKAWVQAIQDGLMMGVVVWTSIE